MKKKVAVMGPGRVACNTYLPYLSSRDDVELLMYSRTYQKAQAAAEKFGGTAYATLGEMMSQEPDLVLVLTLEKDRIDAARQLLEFPVKRIIFEKPLNARNGQHNVCEKDYFEAKQFLEEARPHGVDMGMIFNYRFFDLSRKLKEILDGGELGELRQSSWFINMDTWSHCIDLMSHFGGKIKTVAALGYPGEDADIAAAFTTTNGGTGTILGTLQQSTYISFYHIVMNFDKGKVTLEDLDGELRIYRQNSDYVETHRLGLHHSVWDKYSQSFKKALAANLDAIDNGQPLPVPVDAGLYELQFEAALKRSVRERRPVDFDEFDK